MGCPVAGRRVRAVLFSSLSLFSLHGPHASCREARRPATLAISQRGVGAVHFASLNRCGKDGLKHRDCFARAADIAPASLRGPKEYYQTAPSLQSS